MQKTTATDKQKMMNNLGKHGSTIFKDTFTDKNDINTILFGIFKLFNVLGIVFLIKTRILAL